MKGIRNSTNFYLAGALIITLSSCGGGGGDDASTSPYPDPSNPSAFPTQADTLEGSNGDNTPGTAGTLSIGSTSYHTIYPIDDEDWVAVTLTGGIQYEFSVDNVSYYAAPKLELYKSDGITPVTYDAADENWGAWGYFSFNPRVTFTPDVSDTYYLMIIDDGGGISSYTLSSRVFSDSDSDDYSPHYDCNDTEPTIYPWAVDNPGGGDQSCSGYDWPDAIATDSFEPDGALDDFINAGSLPMYKGDFWDIIYRGEVYAETHTIHSSDVDTFKITVPARGFYEVMEAESTGTPLNSDVYEESDMMNRYDFTESGGLINHWLDNSASATPTNFYLQVYATDGTSTAAYVLGIADGGIDADGDGKLTRWPGLGWDCDDNDAAIYAGATEIASDGIDSNCNGKDDD